ncbi:major capsid protein [Parendozoicomonas sp. Alg238-R29]|uniref:major capsid protein n=1 Tax=Parendozoicomonas sp. Alg238-R29 TaxID=2993446 RepID=UPI00248F147B|nr:major capsid protein [Parendozoicomonas sp. Alg238-R29]
MPALDVFNNDAFSVQSLAAAIAEQPYVPGRISETGLFQSQGITTTAVSIEKKGMKLSLVAAQPRGGEGQPLERESRQMIPFITTHLPQRDYVMADEIQNVRSFGSEDELEGVQAVVNNKLSTMRTNLDATIEYQRMGAIQGKILDADGKTVLLDINKQFGTAQKTMAVDLTGDLQVQCLAIKRAVRKALGGVMVRGWRAYCGAAYFDGLLQNESFKRAYERYQDGAMLRNDPRSGFEFAGIIWEEYYGEVDGNQFVKDDEAWVVPEGVQDMFITRFAPANYMETVNTMGLPYYGKVKLLDFDKGAAIEAQSNPLNLCTRPGGVIKLTIKASD